LVLWGAEIGARKLALAVVLAAVVGCKEVGRRWKKVALGVE